MNYNLNLKGRNSSTTLLIVVSFIIICACCTGGNKNGKPVIKPVSEIKDSTWLFDGKSLTGWEITNFGPQGPVYVSGDEIILGMGDGCTGITWKGPFPTVNYKVSLDAMRVEGNDFFCGMTFAVGKDPCTLIVGGWGGTTVGLSCIDGKDASENFTTRLIKFDRKRWYHIILNVTDSQITATIDTVKVVDFKTGRNRLSIRPEVTLSRPFGIASWRTTAALRNIRLERIRP